MGTGLGATLNVAKPPKGSTVAIFGLGAVGLAVRICSAYEFYTKYYYTMAAASRKFHAITFL